MDHNTILSAIDTYSEDHIFKLIKKNLKYPFLRLYFFYFVQATMNVAQIDQEVAEDFINDKIRAKYKDSFDFHSLLSALCELSILNTMLHEIDDASTFEYEPKPVMGSKKNPEFSLNIKNMKYFFEVKSPNMENYNKRLETRFESEDAVIRYDARIFDLTEEEKLRSLGSTDSKVKDFLVDANKKFRKSVDGTHVNVLFICWTDETDQPATALKYPLHGLLTDKSWYKDKDNKVVKFDNIDLIFITDIYQNHMVHMACTDEPMPSYMSGVPYFDNVHIQGIPNPFILRNSRSYIIEPEIDEKVIFPLPISTYDKPVTVITEEVVRKCCPEFKCSYLHQAKEK